MTCALCLGEMDSVAIRAIQSVVYVEWRCGRCGYVELRKRLVN